MISSKIGFYYVYSGVNVKVGGVKSDPGIVQRTLFHYVHRVCPPEKQMYSVVLLSSVHTLRLNNASIVKLSSMGGVFHLTKGDVIQVRLISQAKIELVEGSNHLGLFLLHSQNYPL
ncbi:unnamed protein product [Lymnaea stagnalis]|uniref:THD domain-containing protein n=1 Tax=Lymnaea stagnalis TaxID=6523 RepID=A0AAV2HCY3_LYMST